MENSERIIDSFRLRNTLNPKVWDNYTDTKKSKLKKVIKDRLSKIANEFIELLGEDTFVEDILLMGSLVNYNWSQYSDFDLHILIDFSQFGKLSEIKKENFELKKDSFNTKHNIKIYGYDVELYAQDENEKHFSSGVYSILTDEWISFPKKEKFTLDMKLLKKKIKCWVSKISSLTKDKENLDYKKLKKLKDKLKTYRKAGLEKKGEISYENLVFKYLRRSGDIGKLIDSKSHAFDKELSIESKINEQTSIDNDKVNSMINSILELPEIKFLKELYKKNSSYEVGSENTQDNDVSKLQSILLKLGYDTGVDKRNGKFGEDTKKAVEKFQKENNLNITGKLSKEDFQKLASLSVIKILGNFENVNSGTDSNKPSRIDGFTYVDLKSEQGQKIYKEICEGYINKRNPNSGITGEMMLTSAKKYLHQGYVPPELALSQMVLEGGLSKKETDKPRRTKNPYNIGNTDSGKLKYFNSFQDGIDAYYDLITRRYLVKGKKAEDLLDNFVNVNNNRYASGKNYETDLKSLVNTIGNVSKQVLASNIKNMSSVA